MGKNNKLFICFTFIFLTFLPVVSCGSKPEPEGSATNDSVSTAINEEEMEMFEIFDPTRISQELYDSTRNEVQQFIERLNQIIQSGNYEAWRASLSDEYFAQISSEENLRELSSRPAMRSRRIVLRTPQDYFTHVVVPSRANLRVDDIEFISQNRVKAFTININQRGEEVVLRLYDLEKFGNTWTIIN